MTKEKEAHLLFLLHEVQALKRENDWRIYELYKKRIYAIGLSQEEQTEAIRELLTILCL